MDELAPDHVACVPILVPAVLADAGLHFSFDVQHRRADGIPEGLQDALVACQRIQGRDALGHVKVEIVPDRAIQPPPLKQLFAASGMHLVAHRVPVGLGDVSPKAQHCRGLAAPLPGQLLSFRVVVGRAVVALRAAGVTVLVDAKHD